MNFIPMIPAESLFRATHAGEGHKLVVHIEAGTRGGVLRDNTDYLNKCLAVNLAVQP